jgi:hypothetical protein
VSGQLAFIVYERSHVITEVTGGATARTGFFVVSSVVKVRYAR